MVKLIFNKRPKPLFTNAMKLIMSFRKCDRVYDTRDTHGLPDGFRMIVADKEDLQEYEVIVRPLYTYFDEM